MTRHWAWSFLGALIYAARGLTLHVHRGSHEPLRIYGYEPMTVEQFRQSELFYEEASEHPIH